MYKYFITHFAIMQAKYVIHKNLQYLAIFKHTLICRIMLILNYNVFLSFDKRFLIPFFGMAPFS